MSFLNNLIDGVNRVYHNKREARKMRYPFYMRDDEWWISYNELAGYGKHDKTRTQKINPVIAEEVNWRFKRKTNRI